MSKLIQFMNGFVLKKKSDIYFWSCTADQPKIGMRLTVKQLDKRNTAGIDVRVDREKTA